MNISLLKKTILALTVFALVLSGSFSIAHAAVSCSPITTQAQHDVCCTDTGDGSSADCDAYENKNSGSNSGTGLTPSNATNNASGTNSGTGLTPVSTTTTNNPLNVHLNNPLSGVSTIPDAINTILGIVIRIALPLIILAFIWSGLSFIFARGNPEKMKVAKNMFFYTVIGTMLILGAWVITNAIVGTVNSIVN